MSKINKYYEMKYYLSFIFFLISSLAYSQDSLVVKGNLKGQGDLNVILTFKNNEGKTENYKATAKNDAFEFKVKKQSLPVVVTFGTALKRDLFRTDGNNNYGSPAPKLYFFLRGSDVLISGTAEDIHLADVKAGKENDQFSTYRTQVINLEQRRWEISKQLFNMGQEKDSLLSNKLSAELAAGFKNGFNIQKEFVKNNPAAFASVYLLSRMKNLYTTGDYATAFDNLSDDYKETIIAKDIKKIIDKYASTAPGTQAISFIKKDKDGKEINLDAYKGKLVLLDFWGSWCGPCRASHPHLKELYNEYKNKGFEIIAIGHETAPKLEDSRKKWLTAIKEDGINWVHIFNNETSADFDLVKAYKVDAFPTKILLDKDGKILLRISASATKDIDNMLAEKLGK